MSVRNDIIVRWDLSPRLITILAPSQEITIQDLHDTLRYLEQLPKNLIYPFLISTAGKEQLGGGVSVGLTSTLQNAQVSFQSRYTPISTGTVTNVGLPIFLTDSGATFISDGVVPGATITNITDGSFATVIRVLSETQLEHEPLKSGILNIWSILNNYKINNQFQCNISGGNLVAIDNDNNDLNPIFPTAFVQIIKTSASSATIQGLNDISQDVSNKTFKKMLPFILS